MQVTDYKIVTSLLVSQVCAAHNDLVYHNAMTLGPTC